MRQKGLSSRMDARDDKGRAEERNGGHMGFMAVVGIMDRQVGTPHFSAQVPVDPIARPGLFLGRRPHQAGILQAEAQSESWL